MRKIGIQEIEDIALGAALLGAGGGGDPYIGKLTAIGAVKECGEVELIGIDEVPDGAFIMPAASMGAPTILAEKGVGAAAPTAPPTAPSMDFLGLRTGASLWRPSSMPLQ